MLCRYSLYPIERADCRLDGQQRKHGGDGGGCSLAVSFLSAARRMSERSRRHPARYFRSRNIVGAGPCTGAGSAADRAAEARAARRGLFRLDRDATADGRSGYGDRAAPAAASANAPTPLQGRRCSAGCGKEVARLNIHAGAHGHQICRPLPPGRGVAAS